MVERVQEEISPEDVEIIYQVAFNDKRMLTQVDMEAFMLRFPQIEKAPEKSFEDIGLSQEDTDNISQQIGRGEDLELSLRTKYAQGIQTVYYEIGVPWSELIDFIKSRRPADQ